jgi:hypothetical protein
MTSGCSRNKNTIDKRSHFRCQYLICYAVQGKSCVRDQPDDGDDGDGLAHSAALRFVVPGTAKQVARFKVRGFSVLDVGMHIKGKRNAIDA